MLRACPRQSKIQAGLVCGGYVSLTVDFAASRERTLYEEGISRGAKTHGDIKEISRRWPLSVVQVRTKWRYPLPRQSHWSGWA